MPTTRTGRFLRNSLAVFGTQLVARGAAFAAFVVIARALGLEDLGRYALTMAAIELLRPIADLGLGGATVRRLAGSPQADWRRIVSASLHLRVLIAVTIAGLLMAISSHGAFASYRQQAVLVGAAVLLSAISNNYSAPFQAALRMERMVALHALAATLHLAGVVVGAMRGWGVLGFLLWLIVQDGILAVGLWRRYAKEFPGTPHEGNASAPYTELLRDGMALGAIAVLSMAYFRVDVLMLEAWTTTTEVGRYGIAYRICEALLLAQVAISVSAYARYAARANADGPAGVEMHATLSRILMALGTFLAVSLVCLAPLVLPALAPNAAESIPLIGILVWAIALTFANAATVDRLLAAKATMPVLRIATVNLVVNIVMNALLIPRHGAAGAAIATVATEAMGAILLVVVQWRRAHHPPPLDAWLLLIGVATVHLSLALGHTLLAIPAAAMALAAAISTGRNLRAALGGHAVTIAT